MSRSIVRRLAAAVTLTAALWAATPAAAAVPRAPRLLGVPGVSLLQQAMDWFQGLFAAPAPADRQEKAGSVPTGTPVEIPPGGSVLESNITIDPNG